MTLLCRICEESQIVRFFFCFTITEGKACKSKHNVCLTQINWEHIIHSENKVRVAVIDAITVDAIISNTQEWMNIKNQRQISQS